MSPVRSIAHRPAGAQQLSPQLAVKNTISSSEKIDPASDATQMPRPPSQAAIPNLGESDDCRDGLTFEEMLAAIRVAFERDEFDVDTDEIWRALEGYESKPADWSKFAYYDASGYRRNLVEDHEKYNVMVLCWPADKASSIHDHAGAHCFMKVLDGEIVESRYAWPKDKSGLSESKEKIVDDEGEEEDGEANGLQFKQTNLLSETRINVDEVLYINDDAGLHSIANPAKNRTAASLHVYIPPFEECNTFDQCTGKPRRVQLNFYSKKGQVVEES